MSHLRIWLIVAIALLVASNALWAARFLGTDKPEITSSYGCTETEQYQEIREELINPIASAINASLEPDATKQSILAAVASGENRECVISSDFHVGTAGLRFTGDKLVAVSTMVCTQYPPP